MSLARLDRLIDAVQVNCHIADARHATELTLCIYLLQMRELYRWEQGIALGTPLERAAVSEWLARREALWSELEGEPWRPIEIDGEAFDPFDTSAVNARLAPHDLYYGAGLAGPGRPGFFLAALESAGSREGAELRVCGCEHARGLFAPPAVLAGDEIVVRRESLARWLWEKFEAFSLKRADGPFKAVAEAYALDRGFADALPRMLDDLGETLILHELGEHRAAAWLEPGWAEMRLALTRRRAELLVRAVRDLVADCSVTLPALLDSGAATAIHFWFAGYDGLRRELFPGLVKAYRVWCAGDAGGAALRDAAARGEAHFRTLALEVLALHARLGERAEAQIEQRLGKSDAACAA